MIENISEDDVDAFLYDENEDSTDIAKENGKSKEEENADKTNEKKSENEKNEESLKKKKAKDDSHLDKKEKTVETPTEDVNKKNESEQEKNNIQDEKTNNLKEEEENKPKVDETETEKSEEISNTGTGETEEEEEEEEEEEDSDSDIEIIMNATVPEDTNKNIQANKALQFNKSAGRIDQSGFQGKSTVDINEPGQYEGQNIFDLDLDSFEEKPWRKPGSDITDYFNYGFNEQTWRAYCLKQRQVREESSIQKRINVYESNQEQDMQGPYPGEPTSGARSGRSGFINEHAPRPVNAGGRKILRDQDDAVIQVMSGGSNDHDKNMPMLQNEAMMGKMNPRMENDFIGNPMNSHSFQIPEFVNMPPENMGMFGNDPSIGGPPPFWGQDMGPMGHMGYEYSGHQRGVMPMRNMPPMQMRNMPGPFWDDGQRESQHSSNNQMNRMQQHNFNFNQGGRNSNNNMENSGPKSNSGKSNKQNKNNDHDQSQERDRHDDSKSKDEGSTNSSRHSRSDDREHKKSKGKDKRSRSSTQDDERWSRKRSHDNDDNQKSKRRY